MPIAWEAVKDPDEEKDYGCNWIKVLGEDDTITASTWEVVSEDSELVIGTTTFNDTTTTFWVTGGVAGTYLILNRIETDGGRTYDQTGKLKVKTK